MQNKQPKNTESLHVGAAVSGMTLVETVVSMSLLMILLGGGASLLLSTTSSSAGTLERFNTLHSASVAIDGLRRGLENCRVESVSVSGDQLTFSIPVDPNGGGVPLDGVGDVVWGIEDADGVRVGGTATIQFLADAVLVEAELQIDLNSDGDLSDLFDIGRLVVFSDQGRPLPLTHLPLLQAVGNHGSDLNNDGVPDPIFQTTSNGQLLLKLPTKPDHRAAITMSEVHINVSGSSM